METLLIESSRVTYDAIKKDTKIYGLPQDISSNCVQPILSGNELEIENRSIDCESNSSDKSETYSNFLNPYRQTPVEAAIQIDRETHVGRIASRCIRSGNLYITSPQRTRPAPVTTPELVSSSSSSSIEPFICYIPPRQDEFISLTPGPLITMPRSHAL